RGAGARAEARAALGAQVSTLAAPPRPAQRISRARSGWRRWPLASGAGAAVATGLVLLPLVFLVVEAQESGWGDVERLLFRHTVAVLLWNTLRLAAACKIGR